MTFEQITFYSTVLIASLPWIILIITCLGGGKVTFESEGLFKQLSKLVNEFRTWRVKP